MNQAGLFFCDVDGKTQVRNMIKRRFRKWTQCDHQAGKNLDQSIERLETIYPFFELVATLRRKERTIGARVQGFLKDPAKPSSWKPERAIFEG